MPIDVTEDFHDKSSVTEASEEKEGEDVRFEHVEEGELVFLKRVVADSGQRL